MPVRIQMRRTKGWRKPANTVYCGRPSKWGSPFDWKPVLAFGGGITAQEARAYVVDVFRKALMKPEEVSITLVARAHMDRIRRDIEELRDKDLGCWCGLDQPCHVDVLLELANRPKEIAKG